MFRNFLNSRGFTLVEVLASVVLLAVVISLSLSIFPNMFRTNDVNEQSLDAVAVAKDALVNAKNGGYNTSFVEISGSELQVESLTIPIGYYYLLDELNYQGYRVILIVNPTPVDGLDLYETTIHVLRGSSIRATNYGYLTGVDF